MEMMGLIQSVFSTITSTGGGGGSDKMDTKRSMEEVLEDQKVVLVGRSCNPARTGNTPVSPFKESLEVQGIIHQTTQYLVVEAVQQDLQEDQMESPPCGGNGGTGGATTSINGTPTGRAGGGGGKLVEVEDRVNGTGTGGR